MDRDGTNRVEVVFALPQRQLLLPVALPAGATVNDAIGASGIAAQFPQHDFWSCQVGIWGRPVERDRLVEDGDRIEIYRPLAIEPRDARRRLAAQGKSMGRHDAGDNSGNDD